MALASSIWTEKWQRSVNLLRVWRAALRWHVPAVGNLPGPRSIGSEAIGQNLLNGDLRFGGRLIIAPETSIWSIVAPDDAFRVDRHGFLWLDHLAAIAGEKGSEAARLWTRQWMERHGRGTALGWMPQITARRLTRQLHHYGLLTHEWDDKERRAFDRSLWRQAHALRTTVNRLPKGLPTLEGLAALALCSRCLEDFTVPPEVYVAGLSLVIPDIGEEGDIPSRSPESLMRWLTCLVWIREDFEAVGQTVPEALTEAISAITPLLRSLRHSDGTLARFHGGGSGVDAQLDKALSSARVRGLSSDGGMGFMRISSGRSSLIADVASPPYGAEAYNGHASTLAFELTSGRRPLIVNCGSGEPFGPEWHQAGRATPSHSVLGLEGASSSRLGSSKQVLGQARQLMETHPQHVTAHLERHLDYLRLEASHDGYLPSHGLLQGRALEMTVDGSAVAGEEVLLSDGPEAREVFDRALGRQSKKGLAYQLRFHLHPDVEPELDLAQAAVNLRLKSGEVWTFRHDGNTTMTLEPSVYLDVEAPRPTATKQIVLTGHAMSYTTRIRWSLAKTPESLKGIRDLAELEADLKI